MAADVVVRYTGGGQDRVSHRAVNKALAVSDHGAAGSAAAASRRIHRPLRRAAVPFLVVDLCASGQSSNGCDGAPWEAQSGSVFHPGFEQNSTQSFRRSGLSTLW